MRLIDADDFYKRMENDTDLCAEMEKDGLKALKKYLDLQPTTYDVDKVVEELDSEVERWEDSGKEYNDNCEIAVARGLRNAIKIVKQGVVSDDVCEWKYNDTEYYWKSSCDHLHIFMSDGPKENEYEYCPYCGKKIKIVGG